MANLDGTTEKSIREAVAAQLDLLGVCGNIFTRRRFITSRQDFARALGKRSVDEKTEINFLEIEFLKFVDSDVQGFDDCPSIELTYGLHLFKQFVDDRTDGTNSDLDFTTAILAIRDRILRTDSFAGGVDPILTMPEFAQFGNDSLTDCKGHSADLVLTIDYNLGT